MYPKCMFSVLLTSKLHKGSRSAPIRCWFCAVISQLSVRKQSWHICRVYLAVVCFPHHAVFLRHPLCPVDSKWEGRKERGDTSDGSWMQRVGFFPWGCLIQVCLRVCCASRVREVCIKGV